MGDKAIVYRVGELTCSRLKGFRMPGKPKPIDKTKTLEYARKHGGMDKFVKEHAKDAPGDMDRVDDFLKRGTGVKREARGSAKAVRKASGPASSDD